MSKIEFLAPSIDTGVMVKYECNELKSDEDRRLCGEQLIVD